MLFYWFDYEFLLSISQKHIISSNRKNVTGHCYTVVILCQTVTDGNYSYFHYGIVEPDSVNSLSMTLLSDAACIYIILEVSTIL